jgi:hypothetical protein
MLRAAVILEGIRSRNLTAVLSTLLLSNCAVAFAVEVAQPATSAVQQSVESDVERGRTLAARWCGNCHLAPEPGDLPRERWPYVVKWMGNYLGHPNLDDDVKKLIYPTLVATKPFLTAEELQAIQDYYVSEAPKTIEPAFSRNKTLPVTPLFKPERWPGYPQAVTVSLVAIDAPRRRVYVGTAEDSLLRIFTQDGLLYKQVGCDQNQAVEVRPTDDGFDLALLGDIGIDRGRGTVHKIYGMGAQPGPLRASRIVTGFHRTSGAAWGDLDQDGNEDVVLAGFGDFADGALSWFSVNPDEEPIRRDLRTGSGALDAVVDDVDGDGDLDVLSIVAQGHQEMWWFENDGTGHFQSRLLWKERSVLGYNSFQWIDFNGDGKKDLIVASGNNMEMPDPPIKPVHGVYVYLQTGPMQFTKTHFLRMDGATKALAHDYDNDGDFDVAVISAYPDWRADSPVAFALFMNEGEGKFTPSTIPSSFSAQPITMDAGDLDGDGDVDLAVGGANWKPILPEPWLGKATERIRTAPSAFMLWNQSAPPSR